MKLAVCLTPAALVTWFISPILWRHGSSAAFDLAIGLPVATAVAGVVGWSSWIANKR